MILDVRIRDRQRRVALERTGDSWRASVDGRPMAFDIRRVGDRWSLIAAADELGGATGDGHSMPGISYDVALDEQPGGALLVMVNGRAVPVTVEAPRSALLRGRSGGTGTAAGRITAPMPGRIVKVLVKPGEPVRARQGLVVIEAMKMENELRATADATVRAVHVTEGLSVEAGVVLIELD